MGRAGLLLVMGLGVAFGWISGNIRDSVGLLTESQIGYYKYSYARNYARLALNRHLRYVDRGITPPTSVTFEDGSYAVSTTSIGDTLWVRTVGMYAESTYTMAAKLLFTPKPFPTAKSAIGMSANDANLNISGKASVDGRNYNADGTALVGSGNLPGVTVSNSADSAEIVNDASVAPYISGSIKVDVESEKLDPSVFISEYESSVDYIFNTPGTVAGNHVFGSSEHPVIVVCNVGTSDTNFSIKFTGDIVGYGILAINGNVKFAGSFQWFGLVMAYGEENVISFEAVGNPRIVGGVMVVGDEVNLTLKGTGTGGKVLYSEAALDKARRIGKLLYYSIVDWWE